MNRRRSGKVNRKPKQADASEVVNRSRSELLIDGYNLLHVTRFKPIEDTPGELKRCRDGLLNFLAEILPTARHREITVVFDSNNAPQKLPSEMRWAHLLVLFARDHNSADELIGVLIQENTAPKQLVVVSSDHQVQVSATRRRATVIDSDLWFDALLDGPASSDPAADNADVRTKDEDSAFMSHEDSEAFLQAMKQKKEDSETKTGRQVSGRQVSGAQNAKAKRDSSDADSRISDEADEAEQTNDANPFPDDYFDGLEEEFPGEL